MRPSLTTSLHLPPGTTVSLGDSRAAFHLTWRSARGLHILHAEISHSEDNPDFPASLRDAAARFKLALALDLLKEKLAKLEP